MLRKMSWAATLSLLTLAGCAGETENPADNVATPSEGAKITNQNPSTPTVDVPNTPQDEAAAANKDEAAETPAVTPSPTEPTPDAKPQEAEKPE